METGLYSRTQRKNVDVTVGRSVFIVKKELGSQYRGRRPGRGLEWPPWYCPRMLPINQIGLSSLDFVITRVLMKLFKSANINLINDSRLFFSFLLPSEILEKNFYPQLYVLCQYFGRSVD